MAKLGRSRAPKPTVLRTNTEIYGWLFSLDRRRKLARVMQCEAACAEILLQPESDPRRPGVPRMQRLFAVARGNLARGHGADWQMAEIERLGALMSKKLLLPLAEHGTKFPAGRKAGSRDWLTLWLEGIIKSNPKIPAKDVITKLEELAKLADHPHDPKALIIFVDSQIKWRPKPGALLRSPSVGTLTNRISKVKHRLEIK
jgi:hypothetical protein